MRSPVLESLRKMNRLVTAPELAQLFGCTKVHVYRLAQRHEIPSIRIGSSVRFDPASVADALAGTTTKEEVKC